MRKAVEWAVLSALLMYSCTSFCECGLVLQVLGRLCGCIVDNGTMWGWYESVVVSNWGRFTQVHALHHFGETSLHTDWTTSVILPDFLLHFSRVNCLSPQHIILGVTPSENPAFFPKPHIVGTSNAEHYYFSSGRRVSMLSWHPSPQHVLPEDLFPTNSPLASISVLLQLVETEPSTSRVGTATCWSLPIVKIQL